MNAHTPRTRFQLGSPAPFTYGLTGEKLFWSFEAQAGRPAALIFAGCLAPPMLAPLVDAFRGLGERFSALGADAILLVDAQSASAPAYVANPPAGVQIVYCLPEVFGNWGLQTAPAVIVIDRSARVLAQIEVDDPGVVAEVAALCLTEEAREAGREIVMPAPVLLIPHILDPKLCQLLIDRFETGDHLPGGMAGMDENGRGFHKIDETKKRRDDLLLSLDDPLNSVVLERISRICIPELRKAFRFAASHIDRILIARYDESGGYFLRHRDNTSPQVAFRHFAISINLNSSDYQGGYLVFPEYNDHRYKPGRGAGILFSASLLHEATPVLKGRRYVLLTFFHSASEPTMAAEARDQAPNCLVSDLA